MCQAVFQGLGAEIQTMKWTNMAALWNSRLCGGREPVFIYISIIYLKSKWWHAPTDASGKPCRQRGLES